MSLEIPEQVRKTVIAAGKESWLDELPGAVDSLAQEWSLTIGPSLAGGHVALVVEATQVDGTPAVLKIGVPGRDIELEATTLRLAGGGGCAKLLGEDTDRQALLLERLGAPMYDLVADPVSRHTLLCDVAVRLWRPIRPDVGLPTGADLAEQYAARLPALWEQAGRPCSPASVADALECMNRRRLAHDDRSAVLVHGDIHEMNALQANDGSYKLIDPAGLRAEPACDLGTIVCCTPDLGDDLWARTERLASRTGVDATAIWEWGTSTESSAASTPAVSAWSWLLKRRPGLVNRLTRDPQSEPKYLRQPVLRTTEASTEGSYKRAGVARQSAPW